MLISVCNERKALYSNAEIRNCMDRTHKIRLVPTKKQETALKKAAGTARFVYNWALVEWEKQYDEYKVNGSARPTAYSLSRKWTKEKPDWSKEIARDLQTQAILNLGKAWHNHWNRKLGKPVFKKKQDRDSFYVTNKHQHLVGRRVNIPCVGKVKLRENLRFTGKILGYTVSTRANEWYISVHMKVPDMSLDPAKTSVVGVDVGCKNIAIASDGTVLPNKHSFTKAQPKLRTLQRKLARQVKGSKRRQITKDKIARLNLKLSNVRNDSIHKFTSQLAKNHGKAVIEDLDIQGMIKIANKAMKRALHDTMMREVHRQLQYKMPTEKAPKFFRSSKTCSTCGAVKEELPVSVRTYRCDSCGMVKDRDLNAAENLKIRSWVTASLDTEGRTVRRSVKRKQARKS